MSDLMNNDMSDTFDELRGLIREGMSKEGIEETIVQIGLSLFQNEAVLQEFLARLVATQRVLVDKNIVTEVELEKAVQEVMKEQEALMQSTIDQLKQSDA